MVAELQVTLRAQHEQAAVAQQTAAAAMIQHHFNRAKIEISNYWETLTLYSQRHLEQQTVHFRIIEAQKPTTHTAEIYQVPVYSYHK